MTNADSEADDREIYAGRILTLRIKYLTQPDGRRYLREIVEHKPGAAAVALDHLGRVLLVRQARPAVGTQMLELPAGLIDPGEAPIECARRELQEETGYLAGHLEPLVTFYTSPGFTDELIHIFVATDLTESVIGHDEEEDIEIVRLPLAQAIDQVTRAEISDAKTVSGLLAYAQRHAANA
ncbi:MAG: NUDIX hydrolase [Chloroflexi bacterium]|nr:NUDIX hydrolase [Chloroflexota bacterium]